MAKFNIEIELDWIDEESSVEDTVKQEIIGNIEKRVAKSIESQVVERTDELIDNLVQETVITAINSRIEEFMNKPRTITDSYGEVVKENVTVEDMLKEQIDNAMSKRTLNNDGQVTTSSYKQKYTVFEYYASKNIRDLVDKEINKLSKETESHIKQLVESKIKNEVADKLTHLIMENSTSLALKNGEQKKQ